MSSFISPRNFGLTAWLSLRVRTRIFNDTIKFFSPDQTWRVVDIGVTSDTSPDSNFFELYYPFKNKITAIGLEDASHLERKYEGLEFIRCNAKHTPFPDQSFDLAFCSAVLEHVGSSAEQLKLISEISRISKRFVVSTPNRFFPVELHTFTLFLHWLPVN